MSERKFKVQAINDEILEKFSLKNRYAFLNNNLTSILSPKEFNFLREVQRFCMRYEKKNNNGVVNGNPLDQTLYDGSVKALPLMSKLEVAEAILDRVKRLSV